MGKRTTKATKESAILGDMRRWIDEGIAEWNRRGRAEWNRREREGFDGLLGQIDEDAPEALLGIVSYLRDYLLERHDEDGLRALLDEYEFKLPKVEPSQVCFLGRHPKEGTFVRNLTPLPPEEELAIDLFNKIRSVMRCTGERLDRLVLGKAGRTGRGVRETLMVANNERKDDAAVRRARWRALAAAVWKRNPGLSASAVARQIATADENPDTIRRAIRRSARK